MLNLLRYDGVEGLAAYGRYAQVAGKTISAVGGSLMYLGQVIESDAWDSIALIYYPSAQAYLAMQDDQEYMDAIPDRTAGLRARLLYPFGLAPVSGQDAVELTRCRDSETVEAQLVRWDISTSTLHSDGPMTSANTTAPLRLRAIGSGLVTDKRWDELVLRRHGSNERAHPDHEIERCSDPDIAELAVVLSQPVGPT